MPVNHLIWNFLCLSFQNIILGIIFSKISSIKLEKMKFIIFSLVTAFLISCFISNFVDKTTIFFTSILNTMLILLSNLYIIRLNILTSLVNTFLWSIIYFFINMFSNFINYSINIDFYNAVQIILLAIFSILLYKITSSYIFKELLINLKSSLNALGNFSIFIIALLLSCNFLNFFSTRITFFIIGSQFFVLLCYLYMLKENIKINTMNIKLRTLTMQIYSMQSLIDRVRTIKHDYNNTLCSIGGYISLNDIGGLKDFYSRLNLDMASTNNIQLINTTSINDPSIYNLLCLKHNIILKNNIKFSFYSSVNYKDLTIPSYELSKILGILLDNAIDAALLSPEKELSLNCNYKKNNYYKFVIKNSYINKDVDINKIYLKGYSSKKVKSGLGLWEVSNIIKSFPCVLISTQKDENYFTQTLMIPAKE